MPRWLLLFLLVVEAASPPLFAASEATPSLRAVDWNLVDLSKRPDSVTLGHPSIHAEAPRSYVHFNGRDTGYIVDLNPIAGWKAFTIQAWFRPDPKGPEAQRFLHIEGQGETRLTLETRITPDGRWYLDTFLRGPRDHHTLIDPHLTHPAGVWHRVELRYDGHTMTSWVDGRQELSSAVAFPAMTSGQIGLGVRLNRVYWFQGDLARVRFLPSAAP